jgi:hypothetical protein
MCEAHLRAKRAKRQAKPACMCERSERIKIEAEGRENFLGLLMSRVQALNAWTVFVLE